MERWKKLGKEEIKEQVFSSLNKNVNFFKEDVIGVPASYLDKYVFNVDSPLLNDAPFLSALINNPNNIGCHTLGESESFFKGTHEIEQELIELCAVDILKAKPNEIDGYVASGGTEANIQAVWIYRNYFVKEFSAKHNEICILCTEDTHYSFPKAANLLNIEISKIPVNKTTRLVEKEAFEQTCVTALENGCKYFIVIANMMTTMFGSVDNHAVFLEVLNEKKLPFKMHIDGAYGGFFYPFSNQNSTLNFEDSNISSVTLDAHKMGQAPYGTGIFLIRKGMMNYAVTEDAKYVKGLDNTLIGSRSGANAVAVWMILMTYGPHGWFEKTQILLNRAAWLSEKLKTLNIEHYRNEFSNIVTINYQQVPEAIAKKYGLVPDSHNNAKWCKVVVMEHVTIDILEVLVKDLS